MPEPHVVTPGIVSAVDPVNHAVKVMTQSFSVESGWRPYALCPARHLAHWTPGVGADVLVLHNGAVVL